MTIAWSSTVTGISTNWRVGEWLRLTAFFGWFMHVVCQRAFGLLEIRLQSEQVLEHDFVQVLPFIWSLQRNYLNGCIPQGLWLWWYGFSAHLLVCYAMCLWYSLSIGLFSFNIKDIYRKLFFYISHTTIKHSLNSRTDIDGRGSGGGGQSRAFIAI